MAVASVADGAAVVDPLGLQAASATAAPPAPRNMPRERRLISVDRSIKAAVVIRVRLVRVFGELIAVVRSGHEPIRSHRTMHPVGGFCEPPV
ncbi:hypothetical protein NicSoilB11_03570 [Arthrobacter sp. NicSoilB11]|nr:hypothetical protein NicSoilB11_03570 [Arthrobacter sp. NicSoilB11]